MQTCDMCVDERSRPSQTMFAKGSCQGLALAPYDLFDTSSLLSLSSCAPFSGVRYTPCGVHRCAIYRVWLCSCDICCRRLLMKAARVVFNGVDVNRIFQVGLWAASRMPIGLIMNVVLMMTLHVDDGSDVDDALLPFRPRPFF